MGIKIDRKRDTVYKKNTWVNTQPKEITDLCGEDSLIKKLKYDEVKEKLDRNKKTIQTLQSKLYKLKRKRRRTKKR